MCNLFQKANFLSAFIHYGQRTKIKKKKIDEADIFSCRGFEFHQAASPAVQVSALMVDGQAGDLSLQLAKSRSVCQIGAKQQTTQNIPDAGNREKMEQ